MKYCESSKRKPEEIKIPRLFVKQRKRMIVYLALLFNMKEEDEIGQKSKYTYIDRYMCVS